MCTDGRTSEDVRPAAPPTRPDRRPRDVASPTAPNAGLAPTDRPIPTPIQASRDLPRTATAREARRSTQPALRDHRRTASGANECFDNFERHPGEAIRVRHEIVLGARRAVDEPAD